MLLLARRGVQLLWDGARYFDGGLTVGATIDFPEACVTSMYLRLADYFGLEDERFDAALAWLLANQLDDGGWNCRTVRFGDRHSCFHTSILALEALAGLQGQGVEPSGGAISQAVADGKDFFLRHRLY